MTFLRLAIAFAALLAQAGAAFAACAENSVEFRDPGGAVKARFTVEVADDWAEVQRGLMHRESLPTSAGMLFVYDRPQVVGFWMKNTLIPLDMIFLSPDGVVRKVHANAVPHDETTIRSSNGTQYVLEINGGLAAMLGIGEGTEMRHPRIDPDGAAWPCE